MDIKKYSQVAYMALLLAVLPMPYAYYTLLRVVIFSLSIYIFYNINRIEVNKWRVELLLLIFLFNPLLPIFLSRAVWIPLDLVGAYFFYKISKSNLIENFKKKNIGKKRKE